MNRFYFLLLSILLHSCVITKHSSEATALSNAAKDIKNIGFTYNFVEKQDVYKNFYDSTINEFIADFNKENHLFKIRQQQTDSFNVNLQLVKTRFATNANVTTGYIISALGLFAVPFATYNSSNGKLIVFGWYAPKDVCEFEFTKSKYLELYSKRFGYRLLKFGTMFSSRKKREMNVQNSFYNELRNYFENIERDIKRKINN